MGKCAWAAGYFMLLASAVHAQPGPLTPPNDGARPGNIIGTGRSLPRSDSASNLDAGTTRTTLAPNLPAPSGGDDIQSLLLAARSALTSGRTGEAQEALERAESRALDRAVIAGTQTTPAQSPVVAGITRARSALAAGDTGNAVAVINGILPEAADADLPR